MMSGRHPTIAPYTWISISQNNKKHSIGSVFYYFWLFAFCLISLSSRMAFLILFEKSIVTNAPTIYKAKIIISPIKLPELAPKSAGNMMNRYAPITVSAKCKTHRKTI